MFSAYEFSFAGESSIMYGLMLYDLGGSGQSDVSFGNKASISETRINNRIQPIHFGVNYHKEPLEFKLIFGSDRYFDRYELEEISKWLTGHQDYQWLSIGQADLEHVQFKCIITNLKPISHGWLPVAFEATVRCDCSYAYGHPFEETYNISGETTVLFINDGSAREYFKPELFFVPESGLTDLKIINLSDNNREFVINDIPSGAEVFVDNVNGIINEKKYNYNLYSGFNMKFFRLINGENILKITGDGTLTISGRLLHNVAG